ncbi:hypothetical protein NTE_03076 [Candidatus Nitrososphaera evergladensis SR1]|uniref:Uncharacterized protein n=1 Tax=Candidatus Nitrososphaera evergladensis SR1 TaxID=1459636 RepID=A0A075MV39_9ARCH|nr:hypothetical protein NTE_03076 [Candidatus Nitrososphaera evergladensis SR1]
MLALPVYQVPVRPGQPVLANLFLLRLCSLHRFKLPSSCISPYYCNGGPLTIIVPNNPIMLVVVAYSFVCTS